MQLFDSYAQSQIPHWSQMQTCPEWEQVSAPKNVGANRLYKRLRQCRRPLIFYIHFQRFLGPRTHLKMFIHSVGARISYSDQYSVEFEPNFEILGHFGTLFENVSQNGSFFDKLFLKKSISYERWGQATMRKSCVYGSSHYELVIKKVDVSTTS